MEKGRTLTLEEEYEEYLRNRPKQAAVETPQPVEASNESEESYTPKKKKKRRKKHYFLRMVLFVAAVVGIIVLMNSSLFDVQKINVADNSYFTAEQIIARSGIEPGQNIFFGIDKKKAKKRWKWD